VGKDTNPSGNWLFRTRRAVALQRLPPQKIPKNTKKYQKNTKKIPKKYQKNTKKIPKKYPPKNTPQKKIPKKYQKNTPQKIPPKKKYPPPKKKLLLRKYLEQRSRCTPQRLP
jgi:hypothetical protein